MTSTFGNGTHPTNAASMSEWLDAKLNDSEENVNERLNTIVQAQLIPQEEEGEISRISDKNIIKVWVFSENEKSFKAIDLKF